MTSLAGPAEGGPARGRKGGPGRMSLAQAAVALALLLGLQPITTDVYLPALPMLMRGLGAPMSRVQLTMSSMILAFGVAQMAWGPVSDRIGRRPVLLAGLLMYGTASLGCLVAGDIGVLIGWRIVQGVALAAAVVCARAIVRDLYEPVQGAQVMALALSGLGVIAVTGPMLGGAAALLFGWRGALGVVCAAGLLTLGFVALRVPETLPAVHPDAPAPATLIATWWRIARHPVFIAWSGLVACTYGGLFTFLAASSFAYIDVLGLSPAMYGGVMAIGSSSYLASTLLCRRWIARYGMAGAVRRGAGFTLAGGALMAAFAAADVHSAWAVLLPYCLYAFGHGIHQPCAQAGVVGPFPRAAGAASALAGLVLALVAFGVGRWLGVVMDGSLRPMAYTLAFWAAATTVVAWTLVQRHAR